MSNIVHKQPLLCLREFVALQRSYFWLPCPKCGKMFAGYEAGKTSVPSLTEPGHGKICCRWCD